MLKTQDFRRAQRFPTEFQRFFEAAADVTQSDTQTPLFKIGSR